MFRINTGSLKLAQHTINALPLSLLQQDLQNFSQTTTSPASATAYVLLQESLNSLMQKQKRLYEHLSNTVYAYEEVESNIQKRAETVSRKSIWNKKVMQQSVRWHSSYRKDNSLLSYLQNGICVGVFAGIDAIVYTTGFTTKYAAGDLSAKLGSAKISGDARFALFDGGSFQPSLTLTAEAKAALAQAVGNIRIGNTYVHADGEASVGVGVVKAEGKAVINKEELTLKGEVGAAAVQGEVRGSFTIFGVTISATGTGELGSVGAGAEFSSKKGEFSFGAKGSLLAGLGFRVKVDY